MPDALVVEAPLARLGATTGGVDFRIGLTGTAGRLSARDPCCFLRLNKRFTAFILVKNCDFSHQQQKIRRRVFFT